MEHTPGNMLIETLYLQSRDCDFTGRWKPSEIFTAMQELASAHSRILGAGYDRLKEMNLAFVLSRSELHMEKYPRIGEKVVCRTWAAPVMKWMYPRYFLFETESGEQLGYAGTIWVLMDLTERKMVAPTALGMEIATCAEKPPLRMPGKAAIASESAPTREYLPGYSELDVNCHVNNTRCVSWMSDALGMETLKDKCVKTLIVNYSHELLPGQSIGLRTEIGEDSFAMSGDREGVNCFALSGELTGWAK